MPTTAQVSLVERVSYISSTTKDKELQGDYAGAATPDLEGALREGGAPSLLSRESFGLLAQYAAVGLVYGTLPSTIYPFLQNYLFMEGTATTSANALLSIPWSLKVFIGMITDNFPIFGYRRRPYMMFGWSAAAFCLFFMALKPLPDPYFKDPSFAGLDPEKITPDMVNKTSPDKGGMYIILMMLTSLGYLIADVAADAVVVEYAQREPIAIRGRTQTAIYATRTFFQIFALCILGFGLNGPEYGGDFSSGMSITTVYLILGIFCIPIVPLTWAFVREEKYVRESFGAYVGNLWEAIQTRAFYQIIAYSFFSGVFASISWTASYPVQSIWIKATNLNYNLSGIFGNIVMVVTLTALLSLGFLFMLPAQKEQTQELKRNGGKSKLMGIITVFYCLFALCWSIMTNIFAIFPETACLKVTGGCAPPQE
ncbi:hypothetical protein P43SY_007758 [Pythium insidiosum]|uniref:Folate-Biopterin Transporter (FBT) family n=1 Tax=Pythium insidiosum TaxID=114742 RepID=A0AAD5LXB1_PYTIN|nr:hypothetical protein P43SY_007758 [Pythium insidiosum]